MSTPLVSICVPCHNADKYVADALDSALAQTYTNIEIIVVNDGSKDDSGVVLETYRSKGIQVVTELCGTASRARNRAFHEARGDFIKFFDADDLMSANMIEEQVKRLGRRQDAVAMSEWGRFYNDDIRTFRPNPQSVWRDMPGDDWLVEASVTASAMMQAGMFLLPRALALRVGPWNENLTLIDDFEYFCRLLCETNQVLFVAGTTLFYRSGLHGSLSNRTSREARRSECEAVLLGTGYILAKRQDHEARLACANVCQDVLYALYPRHRDLRRRLAARVAECHTATTIQPSGGRYFHLLRPWIGWKLARRLQRAVGR